MLTLQEAARFFDDNTFTDTYGSATFIGQLLPFSDSVGSSTNTRRRILDVAADVTIPTQRTVTSVGGLKYVVAIGSEDLFQGDVVRVKYPVIPVENQYVVRTVGELLANSGGQTGVYMAPSYIRRNVLEEDSEYLGSYHFFFSSYYTADQGDILNSGSRYYRVRENSFIDSAGFSALEAVEVDSPIATMTVVVQGVLDGDTDTYAKTTVTGVNCFVEYAVMDFMHEALGFVKLMPGDRAISFLKSQVATVKVGDIVGKYKVVAVSDMTTFWTVLGRV